MKLNANGIEINYEIEGEGPVVTFSHSLACNLSMWDEQVRALKGRYRVLRYDTRGHGQTGAPAGAYTLDQLADDLKGLLDGLGIARDPLRGPLDGRHDRPGLRAQASRDGPEPRALRHHEPLPRRPPRPSGRTASRRWSAKGMEPMVAPTLEPLVHRALPRPPPGPDGAAWAP